jgi:beta-glucosidase
VSRPHLVDELLAQLRLEEKILLLAGADFWHTNAVERVGVPALRLSDGPSGVRGERSVGPRSVSFPCGIAIGATFDPAAAAELGSMLADECLDKDVHILLGPTVNLHRHPLGGRHFESYSEDPWLSAVLAVAYVRSLQSRGVSATTKHFVANDSEFERHTISSDLDETTLRELYDLPFEATTADAGGWSVMAAYNKINGTYAAEHQRLLADVLRGEWGFDGLVVSDWFGTQSTVESANAGLDLEMPGPPAHYGEKLAAAVDAGEVTEATLDAHIGRLLELAVRTGALGEAARAPARTSVEERQAAARQIAVASFVLLKNDGGTLPWAIAPGSTVAVVGPNAATTAAQGGGSARVSAYGRCSVLAALRSRLEPAGVEVSYERGCVTWAATPALEADFDLAYFLRSPEDDAAEGEAAEGEAAYSHDASLGYFTWLGDPAPAAGLSEGHWRLEARTRLDVGSDTGGEWLFSLTQVGRARLSVDGEVVVDATGEVGRSKSFFGFGSEEVKGTVSLQAGRSYDVLVEYFPRAGYSLAGLMVGAVPAVGSDEEMLARAVAAAAAADAVVCVVGNTAEWETEGHDRSSMDLPGLQDELVRRVAAANPRTCVLVNAGAPVSMPWLGEVAAVAQIWFPGEQGGEAAADVLLGVADPGGRLPTTLPRRLEDTPAFPYYPGAEGHVTYGEGLLMGYRHYDVREVEPLFCFGHGLSFTTCELSGLEVSSPPAGGGGRSGDVLPAGLDGPALVEVRLTVTNTGRRAGTEVVQLYLGRPGEREQALKGVAKVSLAAGESARVAVVLNERSFARWDEARHGFVASPGKYEVRVGRSSRDVSLREVVTLD